MRRSTRRAAKRESSEEYQEPDNRRVSTRKRSHNQYVNYNESDREFERRLKEHEKQQEIAELQLSSESDSEEEFEQHDDEPSENQQTSKASDDEDANIEYCKFCNSTGFLICCDTCPNSFHPYCINPPLTEMPAENETWKCPYCICEEPKNKLDKILVWRWKYIDYPDPVAEEDLLKEGEDMETIDKERCNRLMLRPHVRKTEPRQEREFFVKWKYMSYWNCEWVPEYVLEKYFQQTMRFYWTRTDSNVPPEVEDFSSKHEDNDPMQLNERFYRFGVKPEWLQVHRILNHTKYAKSHYDYLVKWRDLGYEYATWESDDMQIPGFQEAVNKYWTHRCNISNEKIPRSIEKRLNAWREEQGMISLEDEQILRKELAKKQKFDAKQKYETQPDFITSTGGNLHPYQMEGLNWMRHCWSQKRNSILADEMGLGKTIQALSFLYSLVKEGHSKGPFLIAAPLSTLINWEREAEFWAPDFYVVTYIGDKASRSIIREHEFSFDEGAIKVGNKASRVNSQRNLKFHVLLTSYEQINVDKTTLSSIKWEALVVDEAHRLKNNQSLFFRNLSEYNIKYRLLLTGTPLQNNLEELFHLLSFLEPDHFNDLDAFTNEFSEISKEDQIQKLHSLLGPHMLRRMKTDVLGDMPAKSELIVRVDLSPLQKEYYKNILTRNYEALSYKGGGGKVSLANILMELKKTANHPYLFDKASMEAPKKANGYYEGEALVKASGKFILLQKMLRKLKQDGHRVLIFSQMTKMLDILEDLCENEGYGFERIDGSITGNLRQDAIDRFNKPDAKQFIFLLSTRAGGLGINLATADTVIIYDSDWNPHADIQAFSRAHRLGQKNKVMIYRFVTRNSVEERITTVAKKKMLLTHLVVRAGIGTKGPSMTKNELDDVLRWGTEELFNDGETKEDENNQAIIWDDDAVAALLDRGAKEESTGEKDPSLEKKDWTNDYLSSFKVAQYVTREVEQEEEPKEDQPEPSPNENVKPIDPEYWDKLLRHHYEQDKVTEAQQFGKGKRVRKQINYSLHHFQTAENKAKDKDYVASNTESDSDISSAGEEGKSLPIKNQAAIAEEVLPPLLSRNNGQVDVLGFNPRQRKAFYDSVMRYGMPPSDAYNSQWLVRDLKTKSGKVFKAYCSLFMRHLCEPGTERDEHFSDGVPREGLNREAVLNRIGIMALIRRKCQEFESENGVWSLPEVREKQLTEELTALGLLEKDDKKSKEEAMTKEVVDKNAQTEEPMEIDQKPEEEVNIENVEEKTKRNVPSYRFNICDGGFTELHSIWKCEQECIESTGLDIELWNCRHDYWLLCGFAVHGYLHFNEIINDPRFAIVNEPFKRHEGNPNFQEIKYRFLQRRYKLLEQALIIEEQLQRLAKLQYGNKSANKEHPQKIESFVEANQELVSNALDGNKQAANEIQKMLMHLDAILNDMKADVSRLPFTVAQLQAVCQHLEMNQKDLIIRLTTKDSEAIAGSTPFSPPAPFVTSEMQTRFKEMQPKFALLVDKKHS